MSDASLLRVIWTGDVFRPASGFHAKLAAEKFGAGEALLMEVQGERSRRSHNHYFAQLHDLWSSLPESLAREDYARSPDLLRKRALIACGFANVETIVCGSKSAAERVAAYAGALATKAHGYAVVEAEGNVARIWTPESQSYRDMGAQRFAESKNKVLDWIAGLLEARESAA